MRALLCVAVLAAFGCEKHRQDAPDAKRRGQEMLRAGRACERTWEAAAVDGCARACALDHSNSCWRLGQHKARGLDGAPDPASALRLYRLACAGGSGGGCESTAYAVRDGLGTGADPVAAEALFAQARAHHRVHCDQGFAPSCLGLANLLELGLGGPPDRAHAAEYRRRGSRPQPSTLREP